ncbi:hypothetical protein Pla52o_37510 [Novipirellula galeiformis]|uniref:Uncharacterized protein n=1 Tax=Novipirellula galeiformis TaxID=2528004 RepID=A0A5C6CDK8_9BACT|nr:hypothetical protein Pla52o_37510 [Novipirellula galeiformis]
MSGVEEQGGCQTQSRDPVAITQTGISRRKKPQIKNVLFPKIQARVRIESNIMQSSAGGMQFFADPCEAKFLPQPRPRSRQRLGELCTRWGTKLGCKNGKRDTVV